MLITSSLYEGPFFYFYVESSFSNFKHLLQSNQTSVLTNQAARVSWRKIVSDMSNQTSVSTNQAGGSGSKKTKNLGDLLNCLGIDDDEIDDLVFEETDLPKEGIKWMAIARVHTSNYSFLKTLNSICVLHGARLRR
jgi:hypothetical protein